jgi:hypothetical protein
MLLEKVLQENPPEIQKGPNLLLVLLLSISSLNKPNMTTESFAVTAFRYQFLS